MSGIATELAEFAAGLKLDTVPPQAVEGGKLLVLDTVGVALAAVSKPIGRMIGGYVESLGGQPTCSLIGSPRRTSPPLAALANGTLASALDFDAGWHLTTHTVPAALAMGEAVNASGRQVLEAFIAGYEAGAALIGVVDAGRRDGAGVTARGWYHVGIVGPIASAIVAGKLLGLDTAKLAVAIGIACSTAGGIRRNFGTMAKAFQAGHAASQGVQAAMLASAGFTADPASLEAPLGLLQALGVGEESESAADSLGQRLELLRGLRIKRFPACTPAHRPVQVVLQLRRAHGIAVEDVESIEADFHTFSLLRVDPEDEVAAGFSLPFLIAVAMVDGEVALDQLRDERIRDPTVRQLMARVRPAGDSYPSGREEEAETVTVRLRDGRVLVGEAKGVDRLETVAEIEDKFRTCAAQALPVSRVQQLLEDVKHFEELESVRELVGGATTAVR